jgi:hypothetical protein
VHQISYFDFWRGEQTIKSNAPPAHTRPLVKIQGAD